MDVAQVKASVKAWEKAFRAEHGRAPTKQDIKADHSRIADQYSLYRKLSKAAQANGTCQPSSSAHSQSQSAGPSRTPRNIPSNEYPTTPTPHSRRSSQPTLTKSSVPEDVARPAKRRAPESESNPTLSLHKSQSFLTPKKPRPSYSGPIVDPNPINPFSATPPRRSPFSAPLGQGDSVSSPFLHASSPRKLRELLQSNSLRKVRERVQDEITPRTKARRRLAGDFVTPAKDKAPTRKRGEAVARDTKAKGKEAMRFEDEAIHEEDEDDDEFGSSPLKVGPTRTFTELLSTAVEEPKSAGRGRRRKNDKPGERGKQKDLLGFFGRIANPQKPTETKQEGSNAPKTVAATPPLPWNQDLVMASPPAQPKSDVDQQQGSDRLSTPPLAPELEDVESQSTPSRTSRAPKIVSFSDDEVDEWDPEGGRMQRRVVITGTRRNVQHRGSISDAELDEEADDEEHAHESSEADEEETNGMDHDMFEDDETAPALTFGGTTTSTRSSPAPSIAAPMLSLLSLRSPPSRRGKMDELRVKAIFNPLDAARLKAAKRGQDVYVSGQGWTAGEDDEEQVLDRLDFGGVDEDDGDGDGDWEEEDEGWKRFELGMDDEEW